MRATLLSLLLLAIGACGGGGGAGSVAPTLIVIAPAFNLAVEVGAVVQIRYLDRDTDSVATTDILADVDGDLETTGDQFVVALGRQENNGVEQTVNWTTTNIPPGAYFIVLRTSDGTTEVTETAAGTVTLDPNSPPVVTIRFPTPTAASETGQLTVAGRARDTNGVASVRLDGVTVGTTTDFATWQTVASLSPGIINVLTAEATDDLGNGDAAAAMVFVDTTPGASVGNGPAFGTARSGAIDTTRRRVLVAEQTPTPRVLAVSLATGDRTILTGGGVGTGPALAGVAGVRVDAASNTAWLLDPGLRALVRVDGATGARTIVSDDATGTGPAFVDPVALDLVLDDDQALVADPGAGAIRVVDLINGDRGTVASGAPLQSPNGIYRDPFVGTIFITDDGADAVFRIGLTGTVQLLSQLGTGDGPGFQSPGGIALDRARTRVLVADAGLGLFGVNTNTGDREIVTGRGTSLAAPVDVTVDEDESVAFVTDPGLPGVFVVDAVSGDRAVVSRP